MKETGRNYQEIPSSLRFHLYEFNNADNGLAWILSDHLGSTTKVIRASDYATLSETHYKPVRC